LETLARAASRFKLFSRIGTNPIVLTTDRFPSKIEGVDVIQARVGIETEHRKSGDEQHTN
jgi:hypothetical protein